MLVYHPLIIIQVFLVPWVRSIDATTQEPPFQLCHCVAVHWASQLCSRKVIFGKPYSLSFLLVISSSKAIIVQFSLVHVLINHYTNDCLQTLSKPYCMPLLLWFLLVFCFSNEHKRSMMIHLAANSPWRRLPEVMRSKNIQLNT